MVARLMRESGARLIMQKYKEDLIAGVYLAAKAAFTQLFSNHRENYYYCSLITTDEARCPAIVAWSYEALNRIKLAENLDDDDLLDYKWSYADSPYYAYAHHCFDGVRKQFESKSLIDENASDEVIESKIKLRMESMEIAMRMLDEDGLFGEGKVREGIVINVEIMPPDHTNTERAMRLNPSEALKEWLSEAAE